MQKHADFGHGYPTRQEGGQDHEMKAVDPDQIPLVEALDDDVGEVSIDGGEGRPQLGLATAVAVDGSLGYVVHAVFGVFRSRFVVLVILFGVAVLGLGVDASGAGVDVGDVVQDRP